MKDKPSEIAPHSADNMDLTKEVYKFEKVCITFHADYCGHKMWSYIDVAVNL